MAHRIKVEEIPHKNANGKFSETKKDYQIIDRSSRGRVVVGVVTSKSGIEAMVKGYRAALVANHSFNHPADNAFKKKHGLPIHSVGEWTTKDEVLNV